MGSGSPVLQTGILDLDLALWRGSSREVCQVDKMVKISVGMLDCPWLWRQLELKTAAPAGVVTFLKASATQSELQPYRSGGNPRSVSRVRCWRRSASLSLMGNVWELDQSWETSG